MDKYSLNEQKPESLSENGTDEVTDSSEGAEKTPAQNSAVLEKKSSKKGLLIVLAIIAVTIILAAGSAMLKEPAERQEDEDIRASSSSLKSVCSMDDITFAVDSAWTQLKDYEGKFATADKQAVFGLNGISPLGSFTPEQAYQELIDYYKTQFQVLKNSDLEPLMLKEGVSCYSGSMEILLDENTYAHIVAVIVPQKNRIITMEGQRGSSDDSVDVDGPVQQMVQSITFQMGNQDEISGNTFIAQGDGSELCLKEDGSFYYYASENDHSQMYYTGTYEACYGQAAVDKVVSMSEYGLTEEEMERSLSSQMDGYIMGGSSMVDIINGLEPGAVTDNRERYQVCRDTFYAVVLHNDKVVMSAEDVRDSKNNVLYFGYYIPELGTADMFNANAASYHSWKLKDKTSDLDVEPIK